MMENHLIGYKNVEGQVVIYMNYSPCSDCAEQIINFVCDPGWRMHLVIYFVQLYKVKRESCDMMEQCCNGDEDNSRGLRHLSQYVTLRNFTNTQWEELSCLLTIVNTLRIENGLRILEYNFLYNFLNTRQNFAATLPIVDCNRGREDGQITLDLQHIIGLQAVRNAFSNSGHYYEHQGVFKWAPKSFFLVVKETIKKFGDEEKTYVFENEEDGFRFLKNIFDKKNLILHMTHSPSSKFIYDLVQLAECNRTTFEVPFSKLHPTCAIPCSPSDVLTEDDKAIMKHYDKYVDKVLVKEYNGFCIDDLQRCLRMRGPVNLSNLRYNKDKCLENVMSYYKVLGDMKALNTS